MIDAHAPEMPTRFAKQLAQVVRGGAALGMDRDRALRLALRCARDSVPPLRLAILRDVAAHPVSHTSQVRRRLNKPRRSVDRQLQSLNMLGLLDCGEIDENAERTSWWYRLADGVDLAWLDTLAAADPMARNVTTDGVAVMKEEKKESEGQQGSLPLPTNLATPERSPTYCTAAVRT